MCVETCVEISDKSGKIWRSYSKHKLLGYLLIVFVHGGIMAYLTYGSVCNILNFG